MSIAKNAKIVVTGAAGLVGQNLVLLLREQGYTRVVAIDRHPGNLAILQSLNPDVETVCADLSIPGDWEQAFAGASALVQLQAQITGLRAEDFERNNVMSTERVLEACRRHGVTYLVHASSSVLHSVAEDDYTRTKTVQEQRVRDSGVPYCILRPTLMFGWFDPKHFGWLARFMARVPVFPIPGDGRFLRQPLYNRDFCRVILACLDRQPVGEAFDIVGAEDVYYVDIIRMIREVKGLKTMLVHLPMWLFDALLRLYACFSDNPPFTSSQLTALAAGDYFKGVDMQATFGVTPTPLRHALRETFTDQRYANIVVER